jgi:hypothetical protein
MGLWGMVGCLTKKKKRHNLYELQALLLLAPFLIGGVQIHSPRPILFHENFQDYLPADRASVGVLGKFGLPADENEGG